MNDSSNADDIRAAVEGPPKGYFVVMPMRPDDASFDLLGFIRLQLANWRWLLVFGLFGAIVAVVVAVNTRPIFRAQVKAVLVDPSEVGGLGGLSNQLGGLAALAGLEMSGVASRKQEAYATLVSASFAREFIEQENLKPILFEELWDPAAKRWRAGEKEPSLEQATERFMKKVTFITLDLRTGMVDVNVEWYAPELAARWANLLVERANERLRTAARNSAERSVEFLNQELAKSPVVELRDAINRLIEVQINNAMLANVQTEYALRVIDPAVPPEKRVRPKRTIMVLVGGFLGGLAGMLFVLLRQRFRGADAVHKKTSGDSA